MAIRDGTSYRSMNPAWFGKQYKTFLYLDRIVIAPAYRRMGIGRAIYDDLKAFARGRWPRITLEVNVLPANPDSMAFHHAIGFRAVGTRSYGMGAVAMLNLELDVEPPSSRLRDDRLDPKR